MNPPAKAAPSPPSLPPNLVYPLASIVPRLDFALLFPTPQPVEVELGCGDSTFLVSRASHCPHHNFLGVERLLGRLRKLDRKGRRLGLTNARGLRIEASYCLEFLLPHRSVTALHVYFPDPWPKARHERHRLINARFPRLAAAALIPGGTVYLRTDDATYFEQMQSVFKADAGFEPVPTPEDLATSLTDFERDFLAQGKATLRAAYRLRVES